MNCKIKGLASGQIFLIVLSLFAFAFIIGESARVEAADPTAITWIPSQAAGASTFVPSITHTIFGLGEGVFSIAGTEVAGSNIQGFIAAADGSGTLIIDGAANIELSAAQMTEFQAAAVEGGGTIESTAGGLDTITGPTPFGITGTAGHLLSGVIWGAVAFGIGYMLAGMFGATEEQSVAVGAALGAGVFAARFLHLQQVGYAGWIGLTVGVVVLLVMYKSEKAEILQFQCLPWEAPLGGSKCEECNVDDFRPCSEYRCRSLGQACELLNPGTTEEKCTWVNPHDVTSPTIETWEDVLTEGHSYMPHATRPVDLGTRIVKDDSSDGCLQAFTPLEFGVLTNEPAQCKMDIVHTETLEEMSFYLDGNNYFVYEHSQIMSLPSPNSVNAENPEISEDGIYDLYIRCQDRNGNENVDEFVINFCVDPSPDTTPPTIVETSILSGSPVAFGIGEIDLDVYVNEPSDCKWSIQDKNYDDMENEMSCSSSVYEMNAQQLYPCSTTLTGIEDREENAYYFRCKDNPNLPDDERNVNAQSYPFSLFGTEPLSILEVAPNETMTGNTETIAVELYAKTDDGANEGVAICLFSTTGEEGSYFEMFETNSFEHRQLLTLTEGNYNYYFRCIDAGGNSADEMTSFVVDVDNEEPLVTRAYHDLDVLKIVTNENAECVYSLNSCNYVFEEGLVMLHDFRFDEERVNHMAEWVENTYYYVKCKDDYGNQPDPNSCSITVSASSVI